MRGFGDLEAAIMDRFWSRGEPATVRDILTELRPQRELAYNTVLTVVDNLYKKGWLVREAAGRAHRFTPTASREQYSARLMRDALDEGGDPQLALLQFVGQMTPQEADALRAALAAYEQGRP
ncbi:BlaI/MecI/CopY family transcriptional regulator [Catellatospora methionotrophica]|uniref:BlaI/MecI/CopY family transcriptional regulator n=1 Tax=Catellatospora methionotrophica TaxID=121620 RepID=UPI0033EC1924